MDGERKVATGRSHILYLDENGSVWGVGESNSGHLGIPGGFFKQPFKMIESGVAQVAAGHYFSIIRMLDGQVLSYGSNSHGQLGTAGPEPFAIGGVEMPKLKVLDAEASEKSSYFVDQAGNLWSAGDEDEDRLGNGTDVQSSSLVRVVEGEDGCPFDRFPCSIYQNGRFPLGFRRKIRYPGRGTDRTRTCRSRSMPAGCDLFPWRPALRFCAGGRLFGPWGLITLDMETATPHTPNYPSWWWKEMSVRFRLVIITQYL